MTSSKSCSDKLALRQCTSLLSTPLSLLISPGNAYLDCLLIPAKQYRLEACNRAFSETGRMKEVACCDWTGGYAFRPFQTRAVDAEFECSRSSRSQKSSPVKSSNISAFWTPRLQGTLVNGVKIGRKQFDAAAKSDLSRREICVKVLDVMERMEGSAVEVECHLASYNGLKQSPLLLDRRRVKEDVQARALKGWHPNDEDDFNLKLES